MKTDSRLLKLDIASWAGFMLFATSTIIIAVCLPEISKTFSTDLSEGGGLETVRNMALILIILLAGMLAQRWGKKKFLTLGQYLIAAGFLLASFAQNYTMLVLALMLWGIGGGFSEALLNALVVDIHQQEAGKHLNISSAFFSIGVVFSALLFGELLTLGYSWRFVFQVAAAGALIVAVYYTVLRFPAAEIDDSPYVELFAGILTLGGFWLYAGALFIGGSVESAFAFWSRSYVDAYLSEVPRTGAVAVVIFAAAMAVGRIATAFLANKVNLNSIMIASAVLGACASALIPFTTSLSGFYTLLAMSGLAVASLWPSLLAQADASLKVDTTILFVLLAVVGILGFGITPWVMGLIGDNTELRAGFVIIPALFLVLVVILIAERRLSKEAAKAIQSQR